MDMEHIDKINAFTSSAEKEATGKMRCLSLPSAPRDGRDGKTYNHCFFTQFFHSAMNRMASDAGLRTCRPVEK